MAANPALIVVNVIVKDATTYRIYEKGFFRLLKRNNGNVVTLDVNSVHLEGVSPRSGRMIIFGFSSKEIARQWWADPE